MMTFIGKCGILKNDSTSNLHEKNKVTSRPTVGVLLPIKLSGAHAVEARALRSSRQWLID